MYFHVSHGNFQPSQVLQPGNWGRTIRQFRPGGPMPDAAGISTVLWEVAMEAARVAADPKLPSRLDCVFVSETEEIAVRFRNKYRAGASIFEVEPVADGALYRGDFALISDGNPQGAYADYMAAACRKYWTEPAAVEPEILYSGSLRINRKL